MSYLTRQQRRLLMAVVFLLVTGGLVRAWREGQQPVMDPRVVDIEADANRKF